MRALFFIYLFCFAALGADFKEGRTYVIVNWLSPLSTSAFNTIKREGIIETSIDTLRHSNDGKKVLMKYRGTKPANLSIGSILWTGTHSEVLEYLEKNPKDWSIE